MRCNTSLTNLKNRAVKIIVVLLFFCSFSLHAGELFSQNAKVHLSKITTPISKIIAEIEKQTDYLFVYNDQIDVKKEVEIDVKKEITVSMNDTDVSKILNDVFKNSNVSYEIIGSHIILSAKTQQTNIVTQSKEISGTVTDEAGEPLIGATVQVKGTTTGVITNLNGNYMISANTGDVLIFSYVGYENQEFTVDSNTTINVQMFSDAQQLETVVVTALGIKRSEKALSYNVQQVDASTITANKDANFINALSGKVAGVNINASSSGIGGVSKVTMRGTKSIMQSSNALYVIDGVPVFSRPKGSGGGVEFDSQGATDPIADINPDDIESMSILTGAAAAALYGSDAANGAIIINTKKGKEGKVSITVNSSLELGSPLVMPRFQTRYGTGKGGVLGGSPAHSWGPHLTEARYFGYKPQDDYFQTGIVTTESVSFSTGTDKNQTYASAAAVNSKGIIPNNKYERYNFAIRNTTSFLDDKMTLDVNASYILQGDRNTTNQGIYNNPLVGAYLYPRGNDWEEAKTYEEYSPVRKLYTQKWAVGDAGMTMQNPYWINYRNLRENRKDRYMLGANLSYQILDWLTLSGRVRLDNSNNDYTEKFFATTNTQLTGGSDRGLYGIVKSKDKQLYADFLASVNKNFGENWNLQVNFGGSYTDFRYDELNVRGPIADGSETFPGEQVGLANAFIVQNLSQNKTKFLEDGWREQTQSLYASAELGYRSTYYLTVTGRNDWASQLAGPNSKYKSFFYPSVGGSIVLSEMMPNLNRNYLSFLKLRASYASVGSAFSRYIANPRPKWNPESSSWTVLTSKPKDDLKPERTKSFEVGLNARFLKNFELDVTYYNAKTQDQVFVIDGGIKYSDAYLQTGSVRNSGLELALSYKNTWKDFTWFSGFTYSMNRNKILELAKNVYNDATGETINIDYMNIGGLGSTRFILKEGGDMGDLYSIMDLRRDANGAIYIDEENGVHTESIQNINNYIKLGSVSPKGNLAWTNNFSWKNFNLGFMVSARLGGVVFSRTQAQLDEFGVSKASADARDMGYVSVNGMDRVNTESWYEVVAGGTAVPQYYTYSATNVRLQEASIGYTFPKKMLDNVCEVKISLIGRNLWMLYNKAPFDPESVATTDSFYQGIDYFMIPSLRNIGFNLSIKF